MSTIIKERRKAVRSHTNLCEGIFWVIEDIIICFEDQVDDNDPYFSTSFEHVNVWETIKNDCNASNLKYDHYPRGRVMIKPVYNHDNTKMTYCAFIYIDDCINNEHIINEIKKAFNLEDCVIKYCGSVAGITPNHYTCHNCRKDNR